MPRSTKPDIVDLQAAMIASLQHPLTEREAKQVVTSAISLILTLFYEGNDEAKSAVAYALISLGHTIQNDTVNRAALGHIAMMFPHLSPEMKTAIIALEPDDI